MRGVIVEKRERGTGGLFKMKGSDKWYAQIYVNGRPKRVSTRTEVKAEAQAVLRKLLNDADQGKPFQGDVRKTTYGALRDALLHNYVERGNKSLQVTADGSETIWGLAVLDKFFEYEGEDKPGVSVTRMTTDAARDFVRQRQAEGVTNSTINTSLACLRRMLRIAYEDRKIQFVPVIRLLKANPSRKGFLPHEKFEELLGHIPADLKPLITFLYYCGVRLGEALQIQWSQVDLDAAMIRLEDEQTKTGEPRTVPLPDVLMEMLKKMEPSGAVFVSTNLRKAWQKACAAAGLGTLEDIEDSYVKRYHGLVIHDLRRSAIRNLRKAGVPEGVAMKISGHKTRSVFDRYNIVDETDVRDAMHLLQRSNGSKVLLSNSESPVRLLTTGSGRSRKPA